MTDRRETITAFLGMALAMAKGASGSPAWPEQVFRLQDGQTTHEPYGVVTVFLDGHTSQLKSLVAGILELKPGMEPHPPHQHLEEEMMLVTEGTGEFLVGGKAHQVTPGTLMFSESNQLHGVRNTSTAPFRFYYFKWSA